MTEPPIPYDATDLKTTDAGIVHQRARGSARLTVRRRDETSVIDDLALSGSSKLLFPRRFGQELEAVLLNTAGGITGGDRFALEARVGPDAALTLTTQAAERIYRASPGAPGEVRTEIDLAAGASLRWLPQETIIFDGASLDRRLELRMSGGARLLTCECLIFGRKAMGETVRNLHLRDRIDLRIDGALAFSDRLRLDGDAQAQLDLAAVADGARAMASILVAAPGAGEGVDRLRKALPAGAGASALTEDLVFLRVLSPDGFALRQTIVPLLQDLAGGPIPKTWMI